MYALIEECDAALVLPGGIGTLAEFAVMWNQIQTQGISSRPLIFIGRGWRVVIDQFYDQLPQLRRILDLVL